MASTGRLCGGRASRATDNPPASQITALLLCFSQDLRTQRAAVSCRRLGMIFHRKPRAVTGGGRDI